MPPQKVFMQKVTIDTISKHTGLSRGTISRALNDRPDISQATKEKVQAACRELNYVPNRVARELATGRTHEIVLISPDGDSKFDRDLARGVAAAAAQRTYATHTICLKTENQDSNWVRQLLSRADGLILMSPIENLPPETIKMVEQKPLSFCGHGNDAGDHFLIDYPAAGRLLAGHLIESGCRHLRFVGGVDDEAETAISDAVESAAREQQVGFESLTIAALTEQVRGPAGAASTSNLGIVAATDTLALQILIEIGKDRIHRDSLRIAGLGNEPFGATIDPALTTIDFCGYEMGQCAGTALIDRIEKKRLDKFASAKMTPRLIVRASTNRPA